MLEFIMRHYINPRVITQVLIIVYDAIVYANYNNTIAFNSLKRGKMF
jgi:hypothetical protein